METLKFIWSIWVDHGTKVLGTLSVIVSGLVLIPDLISPGHAKYWQAANVVLGALTINRGVTNSKSQPDQ
jgi:hypothetical protein